MKVGRLELSVKNSTQKRFPFFVGSLFPCLALVAGLACSKPSTRHNDAAATKILEESEAAYARLSSYSDDGRSIMEANGLTFARTFSVRVARPNLYRIEWRSEDPGSLSATESGAIWSAGDGDYSLGIHGAEREGNVNSTMALASGVSAATVPATFLACRGGCSLEQLSAEGSDIVRSPDESIGGVDCFVIKGRRQNNETAVVEELWIGKMDHLIHKSVREITIVNPEEMEKGIEALSGPARELAKTTLHGMQSRPTKFTETHENIILNKAFAISDFMHK